MMTPLKKTVLLLLPFVLISCWGPEKTAEETKKEQKTMKAKDTPELRERLKAFNAQEHRLEFTDCELRYNGKPFFIGDTLEEVEAVLGKHDYNRGIGYYWKNIKMRAIVNKKSSKLTSINIHINKGTTDVIFPDDNYILVYGIPLNRNIIFKDFLDSTNYTFDDLDFFKHDYNFIANNCNQNNKELTLYFDSPVPYDYKGGGHIQLRGKFRPDKTKPVDEISFQYSDNTDE